MDTLLSLRVFREIVERGSFAAAADKLAMSTAMASKHVAALERRLGARLLNRTSRHQSLTEAGELYYAQCCEALEIMDAADAAVSQSAAAPRGTLKVTAPVWCASARFVDALADYRRRYPSVLVDLRLENQKVDLVHEGYDVALRATDAPSPALIARPICPIDFHLVASRAFLDRHGWPAKAADIARYDAVLPTYTSRENATLRGPQGQVAVRLRPSLKTDDTSLAHRAVQAGMGIAFLPAWLVEADLAAGSLVRVLPDHELAPITLYAVYTSRKYLAPKVRSFIDHFSHALAAA
ncbi:LysR family transcriptional regulator [Cupriavidus malaysiensis]|uniref:LysR family transcriptional regulator n=1 Tax=Cupriavidus malaysiensis TaxID=367825 RepID=A0ABM6F4N3_9BURK|nr:LysR family transcriptional regulator [Cupriavidus malaysiensis]AOZ06437.1 LysR family transcriptional regulator [Cupriavidus malaysiensis]